MLDVVMLNGRKHYSPPSETSGGLPVKDKGGRGKDLPGSDGTCDVLLWPAGANNCPPVAHVCIFIAFASS